jgi:hypothetical protein
VRTEAQKQSIAEANDTVATQHLPIDSDSQTPEGESKKRAPFIPDCFPQTQELFERLVDGSLSLDESSTQGILPMLYAADSEPFLSSQHGDGQTLAHLAARYGCRSLWEILRDSGTNLDVTDKHGQKPHDYINDAWSHPPTPDMGRAPTLTEVNPEQGPIAGGLRVWLRGCDFPALFPLFARFGNAVVPTVGMDCVASPN